MRHLQAPFKVGDVIGKRTVLEGPVSRMVGGGAEVRCVGHYLVRCSCGAEEWIQRRALEKGMADQCRTCAQRARYSKAAG